MRCRYPFALVVTLAGSLAALTGCGGPKVQFDPKPAPAWLADKPADPRAATISAVGVSAATLDVARDTDLATRDAKSKVAQLFQSQIKAASSDWSLASIGGKTDALRTVTAQSVEVRSNVQVEDVAVEANYRDEATHSHYTRISVDRGAWSRRLEKRLQDGLDEVEGHAKSAGTALAGRKALTALTEIIAGNRKGRELEPDVVVMDLLARELGVRAKLTAVKGQMDETARKLKADCPMLIEVKGPADAGRRLVADVAKFVGGYGFAVAEKTKGPALKLKVTLGERFWKTETVADRSEKIHAATGTLHLYDLDGSEVTTLAVDLGDDRYTERDVDDKAAADKALTLAADSLASMFRSAFRKAYPIED
ncbi:MAG: hypothetical protein HY903_07515 [Deltaproteobacteria bacterium]|nr:hypothetical protein [Deltaproteobacteria bacterium]